MVVPICRINELEVDFRHAVAIFAASTRLGYPGKTGGNEPMIRTVSTLTRTT
jgi:hypothetical protein